MNDKTINFINKANVIHNNKYDYSLVEYKSTKIKVKIICPKHGMFEQKPEKHINEKQNCPKCRGFNKTNDEIIKEYKKVHGNKYDYSLVDYKKSLSVVKIICPEHGEFSILSKEHLAGNGCAKCAGKNRTTEDVIKIFKEVHGNKYDYSLVDFKLNTLRVKIICPKHGLFEQLFDVHSKGHGCQLCGGFFKYTKDEWINKANITHNNKYNYSLVDYINNKSEVKIICPEHGEFYQISGLHLSGCGCPKCKGTKKRKTLENFINEANLIHNNKYDYSVSEYDSARLKVKIICPEHGVFEQQADSHLRGCGCPKCSFLYTKKEQEIKDFLKTLNVNIIENDKSILNGLELDIFLPDHNIAIEFDGLYWHNEIYKTSNFHLNKTELALKKGITLIHIFEDEWDFKQDIVKSRIKNFLKLTENKIFGRKCIIKDVDSKECGKFLDDNHLQGNTNGSIRYGLYYNNNLVSIMMFNKPRLGIGNNSELNVYELTRFCNKINYSVMGSASKLLNHFIKIHKPSKIISYADRRWSSGNLYETLNFKNKHINNPNYWYIVSYKRKHRFGFRKHILKKEGYDTINKTEHQIMLDRKIYRIYDCGTICYELVIT